MVSKKIAAQVGPAKQAAKKKAAAKKPQPVWLQRIALKAPASIELPHEQVSEAHQARGPPRLLSKQEVLHIAGASYPTVWQWMRSGTFPRSRIVGGRSMWRSDEIDRWLTGLPLRALKGDVA